MYQRPINALSPLHDFALVVHKAVLLHDFYGELEGRQLLLADLGPR